MSPCRPAPGHPLDFTASTHPLLGDGDVPLLEQIDRENVRVVGAAMPSIVRITSMMQVDPHAQLLGFPFRFPGVPHGMRTTVPSYGSGVIISRDGYIVTNYHVVRDARSVEVELPDKRTFPAHIMPSDADTDIAVLKIDATDLPAMPWAIPTRLRWASRSLRSATRSISTPRSARESSVASAEPARLRPGRRRGTPRIR